MSKVNDSLKNLNNPYQGGAFKVPYPWGKSSSPTIPPSPPPSSRSCLNSRYHQPSSPKSCHIPVKLRRKLFIERKPCLPRSDNPSPCPSKAKLKMSNGNNYFDRKIHMKAISPNWINIPRKRNRCLDTPNYQTHDSDHVPCQCLASDNPVMGGLCKDILKTLGLSHDDLIGHRFPTTINRSTKWRWSFI